ncbi:unnamed protein product [Sphagnum troendelagicum]|uniref:LAGLIDADG endonuclease n=1 Tax=Sphagnum troendelagicum TaxID=128251 RepID=A0ABP0UVD3_9BRYO
MDSYGDHAVTCKHGLHTIRRHDRMPYVQNIIANETGLQSRLKKTGLIVGRKDRPVDILLLMYCAGQDACQGSVITHLLMQPIFMDRAARKSLVAAKAVAAKKHSDDDEKCRRNGLRLIAMTWETFGGSTPESRIMIRKIAIRHADKHN